MCLCCEQVIGCVVIITRSLSSLATGPLGNPVSIFSACITRNWRTQTYREKEEKLGRWRSMWPMIIMSLIGNDSNVISDADKHNRILTEPILYKRLWLVSLCMSSLSISASLSSSVMGYFSSTLFISFLMSHFSSFTLIVLAILLGRS